MPRAEPGQNPRQHGRGEKRRRGETQVPAPEIAKIARPGHGHIQRLQPFLRAVAKGGAGRRQHNLTGRPVEQALTEQCLEVANRLADTRLRHAQSFRGPRKIAMLRHSEESLELPHVRAKIGAQVRGHLSISRTY